MVTAGNILTESVDGTVTKTYTYGNSTWRDLLTSVNGNTISYDAIGNPTTYYIDGVANTMTWEQGRQLKSVSKVAYGLTVTSTYTYDADGIRTSKSVPITKRGLMRTYSYVTQNGKIIRESWLNITLDFIYDESGRPFAMIYTSGTETPVTYYYVLNLQGDVVGLIDESGEWVAEYTYNAWGEILSSSGTMASINPLRYRGYYYDTETGFYYLQSRYYDPVTHRFINADSYASTGQGILGTNLFAYCNNNPVNYIDPTGSAWWHYLIKGVVGAALNVGASWLAAEVTGQEYTLTDGIIDAILGAIGGAFDELRWLVAIIDAAGTGIDSYLDGDDGWVIARKTLVAGGLSYASFGALIGSNSLSDDLITAVVDWIFIGLGGGLTSEALLQLAPDTTEEPVSLQKHTNTNTGPTYVEGTGRGGGPAACVFFLYD